VSDERDARVAAWLAEAEARFLADLSFAEVTRALRALSSLYVERRGRLGGGAALDGAGKRAAFALFYAPLHFVLIRHVVATLEAGQRDGTIVDVGCGTGAAGAAWAIESGAGVQILGVDRHPWAVAEAQQTWRALRLRGAAVRADAARLRWPRGPAGIVAAYTANEIGEEARAALLSALCARITRGDALLVVEPIAGAAAPWWDEWRRALEPLGARSDEWRIRPALPSIVERLDRAAGMNHREVTGRTLFVARTRSARPGKGQGRESSTKSPSGFRAVSREP
jgi:SAM-dependent methyltransferase